MSDSSAPADLIGHSLFGTYTITEKLGEGAMGNVYLAKQGETGQRLAIKLLNAEAAAHEETVARFLREARVISMITHPNVVRVFIFGETSNGISYMAMEHVDGVPLDRVVRGKALGSERSIHIAKQILDIHASACGQVIEESHLFAFANEMTHDVGADKPRSTGYQVIHILLHAI